MKVEINHTNYMLARQAAMRVNAVNPDLSGELNLIILADKEFMEMMAGALTAAHVELRKIPKGVLGHVMASCLTAGLQIGFELPHILETKDEEQPEPLVQ